MLPTGASCRVEALSSQQAFPLDPIQVQLAHHCPVDSSLQNKILHPRLDDRESPGTVPRHSCWPPLPHYSGLLCPCDTLVPSPSSSALRTLCFPWDALIWYISVSPSVAGLRPSLSTYRLFALLTMSCQAWLEIQFDNSYFKFPLYFTSMQQNCNHCMNWYFLNTKRYFLYKRFQKMEMEMNPILPPISYAQDHGYKWRTGSWS